MKIVDFFKNLEITEGVYADFSEMQDVYNGIMVIVCVICAGIAAGLTVGLLSLDITKLEIKLMIGTDAEKAAALSVLPIVKQHHLLLVTLLLFNSIANETLPIFLGALVPNYIAVLLSVTLVLIFGEIIPSALFTGPEQLLTAAKLSKLVYYLMLFFYPIAWPISKILDHLFGEDENTGAISREELEALVLLQGEDEDSSNPSSRDNSSRPSKTNGTNSPMPGSPLIHSSQRPSHRPSEDTPLLTDTSRGSPSSAHTVRQAERKALATISSLGTTTEIKEDHRNLKRSLTHNEVSLMTGILRLSKFSVKDAMIPIKRVSMISSSTRLDEKSLYDILDSGFSRIPVYKRHDKQHILGYLLVKELIVINPIDKIMVENLKLREPVCVKPTIDLMDLLSLFQEGNAHIAVVTPDPMKTLECMRNDQRPTEAEAIIGIVTMEDVLEKLIQRDIMDETDVSATNPMLLYYTRGHPKPGRRSSTNNTRRLSYPSKHHRRPRIFAAGSVVSSDYYQANRMEHFGLPAGKEDSVRILNQHSYSNILDESRSGDEEEGLLLNTEEVNNNYQNRRNTVAF